MDRTWDACTLQEERGRVACMHGAAEEEGGGSWFGQNRVVLMGGLSQRRLSGETVAYAGGGGRRG